MVRVWLYGGGTLCVPLAGLLRTDATGTRTSRLGLTLRHVVRRMLPSGDVRVHCSPGPGTDQPDDVYAEREIELAVERLGGLDALVYIAERDSIGSAVEETVRAASGFLACAREAVRSMAAQGVAGNLVCVCDITGVAGRGGRAAAASASGALLAMVRALAKEVGRQGVSVNALACGPMAIPGEQVERLTEQEAQLFEAMGLGHPLRPEELAATLSLMVRGGHGMTGQVLRLDHGLII